MKLRTLFTFGTIFLASFGANFLWERAHIVLYKDYELFLGKMPLPFPFYPCIIDVLMVFLIYFLVAIFFRDIWWVVAPQKKHYLLAVSLGFVLAVGLEWNALYHKKWAYGDLMPVIPLLRVGLSPVLQMMMVPWLVFSFTSNVLKLKPRIRNNT